jgi:hypothetical protein
VCGTCMKKTKNRPDGAWMSYILVVLLVLPSLAGNVLPNTLSRDAAPVETRNGNFAYSHEMYAQRTASLQRSRPCLTLRGGGADEPECIGRPRSIALPPPRLPSEIEVARSKHVTTSVKLQQTSRVPASMKNRGQAQRNHDHFISRGEPPAHMKNAHGNKEGLPRRDDYHDHHHPRARAYTEPRALSARNDAVHDSRQPRAEGSRFSGREEKKNVGDTPGMRIHVRGLPPDATSEELFKLFAGLGFGQVDGAYVVRERESGVSRGFGFVRFRDISSVENVVASNIEVKMKGATLAVSRAFSSMREERLEIQRRAGALEQTQKRSREWERTSRMQETERWVDLQLMHSGLMNMTEYTLKHQDMDSEKDFIRQDINVNSAVMPEFLHNMHVPKSTASDKFTMLVKNPKSEMAMLARRPCPSIIKYRELRERIKVRQSFSDSVRMKGPMTGMSGAAASAFVTEDADEEKAPAEMADGEVDYKRSQAFAGMDTGKSQYYNKSAIMQIRESLPIAKMKDTILQALRINQVLASSMRIKHALLFGRLLDNIARNDRYTGARACIAHSV